MGESIKEFWMLYYGGHNKIYELRCYSKSSLKIAKDAIMINPLAKILYLVHVRLK